MHTPTVTLYKAGGCAVVNVSDAAEWKANGWASDPSGLLAASGLDAIPPEPAEPEQSKPRRGRPPKGA